MNLMLKIDIYSDIICPWCIIGLHRLNKVIGERFPDLDVDIEHHPFELHPGAPADGLRLDEYFAQKGIVDMSAVFAGPEGEARASGLQLDLGGQRYIYRTLHAHTLLRHARARGTQAELAMALMKAFFVECSNISDKRVLAEIAQGSGFAVEEALAILADPKEEVLTEQKIAYSRAAGVRSVPTFNIGGVVMGCGSENEIARAIAQSVRSIPDPSGR